MINVNMTDKAGVTLATAGKYCADNVKVTPSAGILRKDEQAKTATPTTSTQDITPDAGKALSKVTVNPITAAIVGDLDADSFASSIVAAIEGKGVDVPSGAKLDALAALIESIEAGGGGGGGNIAYGDYTNNNSYGLYQIDIMTQDEWEAAYGNFPDSFFGAVFDANPDNITSGYYPLFAASANINGTVITSYMTVYQNSKISYYQKTNAIVRIDSTSNSVQIVGASSTYSFKPGRTYKWVILW